jgi:hypothetical protein
LNEYKVELPSRGLYYTSFMEGSTVTLTPMTSADDERTLSATHDNLTLIRGLLSDHIVEPKDFPMDRMLNADVNFLLFYLRSITYGSDYSLDVRCSCKTTYPATVDMSEVDVKYLTEDDVYPDYIMPVSEKFYGLGPITLRDLEDIKRHRKSQASSGSGAHTLMQYSLAKSIHSVNGDEVNFAVALREFPMSSKDSASLHKATQELAIGLDLDFKSTCPCCGKENESSIEFDHDFFRPKSIVPKRRKKTKTTEQHNATEAAADE